MKRSWAQVAAHGGDKVALRFYSRLFVAVPETRRMFPLSMVGQRDRLVVALAYTVSNVDDLERLAPYLEQLGRDHRKFGALADHYGPVGDALLATLGDFLGRDWTLDLAQDWADAYALVASTMIGAAEEAARYTPPVWAAEVVGHDRRTFDVAVVTVQPEQRYDYRPGQSLTLETAVRPRLWRYYSPANAPREDGSLELHVRRIPGGHVSSALVDRTQKGDIVQLGSPVGHRLTLELARRADLLMIAGGTGLAPLKALIEQLAQPTATASVPAGSGHRPRRVELFVGARRARELYDGEALWTLAEEHPWLTVTTVVAQDLGRPHPRASLGDRRGAARIEVGDVGEVALQHCDWRGGRDDRDVYVCGSDRMVAATVQRFGTAGCPPERLHYEGFQGLGGDIYGHLEPRGTPEQ